MFVPDAVGAYVRSKARVATLMALVDPQSPVPACPAWTVKDLLGHLVGIAEDVVHGRVAGMAEPLQTALQVQRSVTVGVRELLARWDEVGASLPCAVLDKERNRLSFAPLDVVLMYDLLNHEQDLRSATGQGLLPTDGDLDLALDVAVDALIRRYAGHRGLPPLCIETTEGRRWFAGQGPVAATVVVEPFSLWRSLSGRRTSAEVRGLHWSGDPTPHLRLWLSPVFEWPDRPCGA